MYVYVCKPCTNDANVGDVRISDFPSDEEKAKHSHCFLLIFKKCIYIYFFNTP